jgi:hypothetical protein
MNDLTFLNLQFDLPITFQEISRFRGAFVEMNGREQAIFHNHKTDRTYYNRYPCIQYQLLEGKAGILALEEGVTALQQALQQAKPQIRWKNRKTALAIEHLDLQTHQLTCVKEMIYQYRLKNYLPFNTASYKSWQETSNIYEKADLLRKLIASHLIVFAKGVKWQIPDRFEVEIIDIYRQYPAHLHQLKRPAFDLEFRTHLSLPNSIGLGKGVSHGFGRLISMD